MAEMTTEQIEADSVLLSFETLVRKPREFVRINGDEYLLASYDDLSFAHLAAIERRRRVVQSVYEAVGDVTPERERAGDVALREIVELLIPDAARTQVMWTPPATDDDPDPQPRPVKVTDTLDARWRLSVMNLFTPPSARDAIETLARALLRGRLGNSTSDTLSPDSTPPTDPHPSPAGIG